MGAEGYSYPNCEANMTRSEVIAKMQPVFDNIFLDMDPAAEGSVGQIVDWWHEGGASTFQSRSLREWLNEVVAEVKSGAYKFGGS